VAAVALFFAVGCRPDKQVPQGADSLQTAGLPSTPLESLPAGRALAGSGFTPVTAIVGLSAPESARYDSAQDCWFVSNTTATLTARDNSGFISRIRVDGVIDSLRFVAGGRDGAVLNAPTGLDVVGDTLWVADISAVRAFSTRTGAPIRTVDLAPLRPRLLNDLVAGPDGDLYVTDTGIAFGPNGELQHPGPDRVYRIDRKGRPSVALPDGTVEGPNGIAWSPQDRSFLIVSFTGDALYRWRIGSHSATRVGRGAGRWDGIEVIDGERALVTSWADSSLYVWSRNRLRRVLGGLPQPADIGIDTRRGRVAIPVSSENRVELWAIPSTGAGR
jgi:hypothetical protein